MESWVKICFICVVFLNGKHQTAVVLKLEKFWANSFGCSSKHWGPFDVLDEFPFWGNGLTKHSQGREYRHSKLHGMLRFVPRVFLVPGFRLHRNNRVLLEIGVLTAFFFTDKLTQTSRESKVILPKITGRARNCKSWFWFCVLATLRFYHFVSTHAGDEKDNVYDHWAFLMCFLSCFTKQTFFFIWSRSYCQCWFMSLDLNINLHCLKMMFCTWLFVVLNYDHRKSI